MAVSSEHQAINIEPLQQQPKKRDANGEEIIFEGICYKRGFRNWVFFNYCIVPSISIVGMIVGLIVSIWCCFKVVKDWKLYLTRDKIYYTAAAGSCCCPDTMAISLSDIDDIYVAQGTKNIWVRMEPSKVNEYIPWCSRPVCWQLNCLVLSYVANGNEFVDAVKKEMANK